MEKPKVGMEVIDRITGFKGIAVGRVEYLTGCVQFLVQPGIKEDGGWRDSHWFDEDRLAIVNSTVIEMPKNQDGCDSPAPCK